MCRPNPRCESDADCDDGAGGCVPTRFCIVQARVGRGMTETVADACDPSGPCGTGAPPEGDGPRCVEVSRCVYPPARREAAPVREGGCAGCLVAPRAAAELAPLALVLLALAQRRRR
ncbi:MAG TPA: MYXO-CTERM sorting domain-containing protein [Sandaracinaceae bacterium]